MRFNKQDMDTLVGDMELIGGQMQTTMMEQHQLVRNFSRLAYAVLDTVILLRKGESDAALEACITALKDVTATAYENDYDTGEWVHNWLGGDD